MNFIFDLGNVLVDWNPDKFIAAYDISDDEKKLIRSELFEHPDWLALDKGTKSPTEVIANITERSPLSQATIEYCIEQMKLSLDTIEETAQMVKDLSGRGYNIYCLSNMSVNTYDFLKGREFFSYFDDIIISGKIKMIKPDRDIFEYTLEKFGVKAEESLFIDDSEANIIAAQKLKINCVHFKRTPQCYESILSFIE